MKRLTLDLTDDLHRRIKIACVSRGSAMVEEITKLLEKEFPKVSETPVLFRFKNDFLERIDAAAKKQELPRQAWVRTVIARELEAEGL